jgi:spore coat polysaccharide biosynthesis protein SpsF
MSDPLKVTAIVQARMSSTRLPGKVLLDLSGAPMLQRQLERVQRATLLSNVVVATSTDVSDDPIAALCAELGVDCYRGDLSNVLGRFVGAIDAFPTDVVVRITADCPLISPQAIDSVVRAFLEADCDYLSNTLEPTFPDGVDIEVMTTQVLREVSAISSDQLEREHVTLGIYRRPDHFSVRNYRGEQDLSDLRWTVDSPDDLEFVTWVYESLFANNPHFEMADVLELLARRPENNRTSRDAKRNAALDGVDTGAMKHS